MLWWMEKGNKDSWILFGWCYKYDILCQINLRDPARGIQFFLLGLLIWEKEAGCLNSIVKYSLAVLARAPTCSMLNVNADISKDVTKQSFIIMFRRKCRKPVNKEHLESIKFWYYIRINQDNFLAGLLPPCYIISINNLNYRFKTLCLMRDFFIKKNHIARNITLFKGSTDHSRLSKW